MKVNEIMTRDPACCTPETRLQDIARLMSEQNCGAIPVVENENSHRLLGIVTDRDIALRAFNQGEGDPSAMTAADCMTKPVYTVQQNASIDDCWQQMAEHQVRRVPVVDEAGECCGIVAQADLARSDPNAASQFLRRVSQAN